MREHRIIKIKWHNRDVSTLVITKRNGILNVDISVCNSEGYLLPANSNNINMTADELERELAKVNFYAAEIVQTYPNSNPIPYQQIVIA